MLRREFSETALALLLTFVAWGCTANTAPPPKSSGVPVVVVRVSQKMMPVEVTAVGNVEPISTVAIKAQISGQLLEVHFKEGDFVRKGQLLFTIDPRPYEAAVAQIQANIGKDQAQLQQAEATLAHDNAQLDYARAESQRYATLVDRGLIATDQSEQVKSQANALQESVRADRAAIESARAVLGADQSNLDAAKLQLSYCTILSPIDGRTGAVMLKAGNLIKSADVPIVVINQVNPIYVNFAVPQQYWVEIKKNINEEDLHVTATVPQDPEHPKQGTVIFADNAVDSTTGNLHIRASFANSDNQFLPGMFLNVELRLSEHPNAKVVPSETVTAGPNGQFIYVVKPDMTVEMRPVTSSYSFGGESVIDSGIQRDEIVVKDGQSRLVPGAKVQIMNPGDVGLADPPAAHAKAN
jgi:multidrug efflux system membrane fusion protein